LYGSAARDFSYIDAAVLPGQSYYRVRGIELQTGRSIASRIISGFSGRQSGSRIYPSPFSHSFFIVPPGGESPQMISVLDIAGNNIPIRWQQEGTQWRVIPQGIYSQQVLLVRVVANNRVEWQKILYKGL
jgi:hypothetical protein